MFMLTCTQKKSADLSVTRIKKGCFVVPKNGCFGELNFYNETTSTVISCDLVTKGKKGCFVVTKIGCYVELENKNETSHQRGQLGEISCD